MGKPNRRQKFEFLSGLCETLCFQCLSGGPSTTVHHRVTENTEFAQRRFIRIRSLLVKVISGQDSGVPLINRSVNLHLILGNNKFESGRG